MKPFQQNSYTRRQVLGVGLSALAGQVVACSRQRLFSPEGTAESVTDLAPREITLAPPEPEETWLNTTERLEPSETLFVRAFLHRCADVERAVQQRYRVLTTSDTEERLSLHERKTLSLFIEQALAPLLSRALDLMVKGRLSTYIQRAVEIYTLGGRQGLVYTQLRAAARRHQLDVPLTSYRGDRYYATRVRDFCPSMQDLRLQDIDPRNTPGLPTEAAAELRAHPGWSETHAINDFQHLFQQASLRGLATEHDLTLAECFSLLKAIIHEKRRSRTPLSSEVHAQRFLQLRHAFCERRILDSTTENVLLFAGYDDEQDARGHRNHAGSEDRTWDQALVACGVLPGRIQHHGFREGDDPELCKQSFLRAIRETRGITFISLDSHGHPERILVAGAARLTPTDVARALLGRLNAARSSDALENVTICVQACYSHDFSRNLYQALQHFREQARTDPTWNNAPWLREFAFPLIVSSSQADAQSTHSFKLGPQLQARTVALSKDGGLMGMRILQDIQPKTYSAQDYTLFSAGDGREFAHTSRPRVPLERV